MRHLFSPERSSFSIWHVLGISAAMLGAGQTLANNGVQLPGYGAQAQGMGGVSIALPQDAVASANNPAGMALVGNRVDFDLTVLRGPVDTTVGSRHYSDTAVILVPTGGFSRVINDDFSWGVSVFGNGVGLDYGEPVFGTKNLRSDFVQLIVAPTLTYQFRPGHYLGISPRLAIERLDIAGLEGFGYPYHGADYAYGAGFALGYIGEVAKGVRLGLTYASPIRFEKMDDYAQILPEGRINAPQQAGIGLSYKPVPQLTLAADYLWIDWSSERAYGNRLTEGGAPGSSRAPGFGWRDQHVFRAGVAYDWSERWTVRGGVSFASTLIPDSESSYATLAPLMEYDHYSLGATYRFNNGFELTGSYTLVPRGTVHGKGASAGVSTSARADYLNLGISYRY
ncbi:long-chain fatty acid transport protein [Pseudomonas duriflava]|uniref:Long-chain fatty acid transport protein n=1 Tax=Pseudomonas duriflava TaxID=459528 RepID=A0A562QNG5_9PSED|nr:outer membrane protein transport protein [Pseudomonas duriflava]TWI57606.1 long-chain fatty acid transport protein [Pseudomonas duriflava]